MQARYQLLAGRINNAALALLGTAQPVIELSALLRTPYFSAATFDLHAAAGTKVAAYTCGVNKRARLVNWYRGDSVGAFTQWLYDGVGYRELAWGATNGTDNVWIPAEGKYMMPSPPEIWLYPGWSLCLETTGNAADTAIASAVLVEEEEYNAD